MLDLPCGVCNGTGHKHGRAAGVKAGCQCDLCTDFRKLAGKGRKAFPEYPHGTRGRYVSHRHRCRCDDCRAANAEFYRQARAGRQKRLAQATIPHGRASTYNNWNCRCAPCTEAHSIALRERVQRFVLELAADPDDRRHGTVTGYTYGCRCTACKDASSADYERRRSA